MKVVCSAVFLQTMASFQKHDARTHPASYEHTVAAAAAAAAAAADTKPPPHAVGRVWQRLTFSKRLENVSLCPLSA
jgi:hypothetical protein